LGLLRVRFPGEVSPATLEGLQQAATVVAYVVFAASRFTDMYEQARRHKPLALDAEMQWNLLPIHAFAGPQFEVAGQLMPAYDVGGDSFDYSVESDTLHVSLTDAMGHGIRASLLDALTVSALRNARRADASLVDQVQRAHAAVHGQFNAPAHRSSPPGGEPRPTQSGPLATVLFVTALVARIDLHSGVVSIVNAGHPSPHLIRGGEISQLTLSTQLPLGLLASTRYVEQVFTLRPGDRLFFISDGVTDAGPRGVPPFGEERMEDILLSTLHEPPHESVRHMLSTVAEYQQGNFRDDATALCLDWYGEDPGR
jgi:serine phosphatase RsbU (regulator of sigma subunit)